MVAVSARILVIYSKVLCRICSLSFFFTFLRRKSSNYKLTAPDPYALGGRTLIHLFLLAATIYSDSWDNFPQQAHF
jgi:hypothetical protein